MKFHLIPLASALSAALVIAQPAQAATILTFGGLGTNVNINPTFASNVSSSGTGFSVTGQGTPDIQLNWSTGNVAQNWQYYDGWQGGNPALQLDNVTVGSTFTVLFTPQNGVGVAITSFDLAYWDGDAAPEIFNWQVQRASDNQVMVSGDLASFTTDQLGIAPNFVAPDSEAYRLVLTRTGGSGGFSNGTTSVALDNLTFSQQAVPEPSTAVLALAGICGLVVRRRRK